jgi:hypothetical protein
VEGMKLYEKLARKLVNRNEVLGFNFDPVEDLREEVNFFSLFFSVPTWNLVAD